MLGCQLEFIGQQDSCFVPQQKYTSLGTRACKAIDPRAVGTGKTKFFTESLMVSGAIPDLTPWIQDPSEDTQCLMGVPDWVRILPSEG